MSERESWSQFLEGVLLLLLLLLLSLVMGGINGIALEGYYG